MDFTLCYITDRRSLHSESLPSFIEKALRAGVGMIQIREKDVPVRDLCELAAAVLESARATTCGILVNDRLDVALALGAAGVHLASDSLPPAAARRIAPPGFLVGVSCHSVEQARSAEAGGADYVLLGPVFDTPSKRAFGPPLGLDKLGETARALRIPVLALGGVTPDRVAACLHAGARGVAGIRLFQEAPSLKARVEELRACF